MDGVRGHSDKKKKNLKKYHVIGKGKKMKIEGYCRSGRIVFRYKVEVADEF